MSKRNILWTGGFDSTFQVIDALRSGDTVDAYGWRGYGMERGWQKADNEDKAKERVKSALPKDLRNRLRDVRIPRTNLYTEQMEAYNRLINASKGSDFSAQNWILMTLPKLLGLQLETGFVKDDLLSEEHWREQVLVASGLSLPLLTKTKQQLLDEATNRGFDDILRLTWSCEAIGFSRLTPCGECEPCQHRIL